MRAWDRDRARRSRNPGGRLGDRRAPVEAPVGLEHVAARPDDAVRITNDVALALEQPPRAEVVVVHVSVESARDLDGRVQSDADAGVAQPGIQSPPRLGRYQALAEIVGKLDQVGAAARIQLAKLAVDARAVGVLDAVEASDLVHPGLVDELKAHAERQLRVACTRKLAIARFVERVGDHGYVRYRRQRLGSGVHVRSYAPARDRVHFARDEDDLGHGSARGPGPLAERHAP
jgi:hypothetical protein